MAGQATTQLYSCLYHAVRRTSFVKLVMLFGTVDVADRILASLSQDSLEVLYVCIGEEVIYQRHQSCRGTSTTAAAAGEQNKTDRARVRRVSLADVARRSGNVAAGSDTRRDGDVLHPTSVNGSSRRPCDAPPSRWLLVGRALVACVSTSLHSLVLLLHVATLNVAINAQGNSLLALLIGHNLTKLKSVIFKKHTAETLCGVCARDALERLQYVVFFLVMLLHRVHERLSEFALTDILIILFVEIFIDCVKLVFVAKLNGVAPSVFLSFAQLTLVELSAETVLWRLPELSVVSMDGTCCEAQAREAAELLAPSHGFAPKHAKRTGVDGIAYAALLLWSCGRVAGFLLINAPIVCALLSVALVLLKLVLSATVNGVCARFTLRKLVMAPPAWAAPSSSPDTGSRRFDTAGFRSHPSREMGSSALATTWSAVTVGASPLATVQPTPMGSRYSSSSLFCRDRWRGGAHRCPSHTDATGLVESGLRRPTGWENHRCVLVVHSCLRKRCDAS